MFKQLFLEGTSELFVSLWTQFVCVSAWNITWRKVIIIQIIIPDGKALLRCFVKYNPVDSFSAWDVLIICAT